MRSYPNPLYDGTPNGALFSHYELEKVAVDPSGECERIEEDENQPDAAKVMWSIYGRYGMVNDRRGAECIGDFDTLEFALSVLRAMGIRATDTDEQEASDHRLQHLVTASERILYSIRYGQAVRFIRKDEREALATALAPFTK